jgi:hypothetical protein
MHLDKPLPLQFQQSFPNGRFADAQVVGQGDFGQRLAQPENALRNTGPDLVGCPIGQRRCAFQEAHAAAFAPRSCIV